MSKFIIKYTDHTTGDTGYVEAESMRTGFRVWAFDFNSSGDAYEAIGTLCHNPFWDECTFEVEQLN